MVRIPKDIFRELEDLLGESSWTFFAGAFALALQIALGTSALLPLLQVGLIVVGLGFQFAILHFLIVPSLKQAHHRDGYELMRERASMFLRHHQSIMGDPSNRRNLERSRKSFKSSRLNMNIAVITQELPWKGEIVPSRSRHQLKNVQKRGLPRTPGISHYSKCSVRSLIKSDMSRERLSYLDFDLTRYGSTTCHLYKERKPIIFQFLPNDSS